MQAFVAQASSLGDAASLVRLATDATSHPDVFGFGELLDVPRVRQLATSAEAQPALRLLELFAYGTLADYRAGKGLPPLSDAQLLKLRQLTLASVARGQHTLDYQSLLAALELASVEDLERFLISECIYKGVVRGFMDNRQGRFQVTSCVGRDVRAADIPNMIESMERWMHTITRVIENIDTSAAAADSQCSAAAARANDMAAKREAALKEVAKEACRISAEMKGEAGGLFGGEVGPGADTRGANRQASKRHRGGERR
ncbi:unnamed protein product [Pedinophyceae sp. YPF-701]|nr:unnamed protein product [Pedinophyceae sp. YPF-701]